MSWPPTHEINTEWHTPLRIRIQALRDNAKFTFRQIWDVTKIPLGSIHRIYFGTTRRAHHDPEFEETRDRPNKISRKDIRNIELILEEDGFCSRALI